MPSLTFKEEENAPDVTFIKMDMAEVCPDKPVTMQKPRKSGKKIQQKRYKPPVSPPIIGSAVKLITGNPHTSTKTAIDTCFRLREAF